MPTNKLGLPLLTGNETADMPRDFNALAEKIDEKAGSPDGLAQLDGNGKTPITQLPDASTSQKGATKLNDTTNSTSTTEAATANAVKKAYDRAEAAFSQANSGKTDIASVIGSPATSGDTFTQLKTHIQNSKNTLATNLTAKGTTATATETLAALVAKVANVNTGRRWASGEAIASNSRITVTGLPFTPSILLAKSKTGTSVPTEFAVYAPMDSFGGGSKIDFRYLTSSTGVVGPTFTQDGFSMNVGGTTGTHIWLAIE